jgi:hypothetical protein
MTTFSPYLNGLGLFKLYRMKQGIRQYLSILFLLLWAVASSPFLSILAISAHGSHSVILSPLSGDVTFQHTTSEQADDSHSSDGHTHDDEGNTEDHHAKVSLGIPTAQTQLSVVIPEPRVVFALSVTFQSLIEIQDQSINSLFGVLLDRIDKPPASQLGYQTTVLLI